MRSRADKITKNVPEMVAKGVAILNTPLTLEDLDAGDTSFPELSLMDKDEFEEFLTVSQLVFELEPRFIAQVLSVHVSNQALPHLHMKMW